MRKYIYSILIFLMLISSNAEAFLDIFETYGKRHMNIRKTFVEALNTKDKKWKQDGATHPNKEEIFFVFIPEEQDPKNWQEKFSYYEFNLNGAKDSTNCLQTFYEHFFSEKKRSRYCTENIIFQNNSELHFEAYMTQSQCIMSTGAKHMLFKIVQVGEAKFIAYQYQIKNRNLSQEEKNFWFQMFDYARIEI